MDPDDGDTADYSVDDDRFETKQDGEGGWWLKLKDGVSLDHEAAGTVTVKVTVEDSGGLMHSTDVTVTVQNVNEAPSAPTLSDTEVTIQENMLGAPLTVVRGSVDPEGGLVTYEVVDDDRFEIRHDVRHPQTEG